MIKVRIKKITFCRKKIKLNPRRLIIKILSFHEFFNLLLKTDFFSKRQDVSTPIVNQYSNLSIDF